MLTQAMGLVMQITDWDGGVQELTVRTSDIKDDDAAEDAALRALNYVALTGQARFGDRVLINTTARTFHLGTGGYDFVIANLTRQEDRAGTVGTFSRPPDEDLRQFGHIIKGRYLPCQQAVLTLEEQEQYADVWERDLGGFPVLVGQLHSQIAPAAAGLRFAGLERIAYVMTDAGALPLGFSRLVRDLKAKRLLAATMTCGQAFGGDFETVTLHSALLAAKHILRCDAAIVCQGPGNAGTGTKYGFSGIEQAQNLDIVKALGGASFAIVRMSGADARARHQGISHHTRTALDLTYSRCVVAVPLGTELGALPPGHQVREIDRTWEPLSLLANLGITVTTMGRTPDDDPIFFQAAAAAGMAVTEEF